MYRSTGKKWVTHNTTMYAMAGLLVIAFLANALIRSVARHLNVKTHIHSQKSKLFCPG